MQVRVLGAVELLRDGPVALGGPNQQRLLAALAIRRDAVVSVASLVDVVWPNGVAPARADHNVRTYIHRLRMSLAGDGDRIETIGPGYRFHLDGDELDAALFERLGELASRAADAGDLASALDLSEEAQRLWRGRPIEPFEDEPWAVPTAVRLREQHATVGECRASVLVELGRPTEAIGVLEELVRSEPLREAPRALLMRALYDAGRHTEALRAYREFRNHLVEEIGIEPSSDLVALDRSIAQGDLPSGGPRRRGWVTGYELHEQIGEGAFAVVHRATQPSLGRDVAVKIVRAEFANRPEFIRRFEAEAQTVARLEHANVVPLYDFWREPGGAFLAMRLMTAGSLAERLEQPWSLDATVELVDRVAAALEAAHHLGVVHRDVKPENILFDLNGRAYLGDFGIALDAERPSDPEVGSGGSPVFAAPEQLRREPVGPAADIHALAVVAYTVLVGQPPFTDSVDPQMLRERQLHEAIPSLRAARPELPAGLDEVLAIATAKDPHDRWASADAFASAFRLRATGEPDIEPVVPAPSTVKAANPYKGLDPFTEVDAASFSGRDRLTAELLAHLNAPDYRLLAVVGPSGSGKSSVVRAGVIPGVRGGLAPGAERWFITAMTPGDHPFEALETALLRIAVNPPTSLLDQLQDGDRGLLRSVRRVVPDDDGVVLLVVDQFEELFTTSDGDGERDHFLRAMATAICEPSTPLRVLMTLRADFFDRPLRHPAFAPLLKRSTVAIAPLGADELERAVVEPAATSGASFEAGLVAEIVADVTNEPGALPLMQYALTRAYEHSDGTTITVDDYRAVGGLTGAVAQRAEEIWQSATTEERAATRRLFGRLVTLGEGREDTRRRVRRSELGDDPSTLAMVERFGAARLLSFDRDAMTRQPTVEVAHEAVLREWPRLREWRDEDRDSLRVHRHLTAAAAGWVERRRDRAELYRGGRLDAALALRASSAVALNTQEEEYLEASAELREEERSTVRRRTRRRCHVSAAIVVVAAVAVTFAVVAERQRTRADVEAATAEGNAVVAANNARLADDRAAESDRARQDAEAERTRADEAAAAAEGDRLLAEEATAVAEQQRLEAQAVAELDRDPAVAALLAVEANRLGGSVSSASALHRVLTGVGGIEATIAGAYLGGRLSEDGTKLVAFPVGGVDVWDLSTRQLVRRVEHGSLDLRYDVSRDASRVALSDATGTFLVDVASGAVVDILDEPLGAVALSPDGSLLATGDANGVRIWDISRPDAPELVDEQPTAGAIGVLWNPAGDSYAVVTYAMEVQYRRPGVAEPLWTFQPPVGRYGMIGSPSMLFGSDGASLVVANGEQQSAGVTIRTYATADGTLTHPEIHTLFDLDALSWVDETTEVIGTSSANLGVHAYDLRAGAEVAPPIEATDVQLVGYSAALDRFVTTGLHGITIRKRIGSGPLERVIELPAEHRAALADGGNIYASVAADGRLTAAVFQLQHETPTIALDLTDPSATWQPLDVRGLPTSGGRYTLMTLDEMVMLGPDLEQLGTPVATPVQARQFFPSPNGRAFAVSRSDGAIDLHRSSGELIAQLRVPGAVPEGAYVFASFSPDGSELIGYTSTNNQWAVWDVETGTIVDSGPSSELTGPRFGGDTLYAERGLLDQTILQLDPTTRQPVGPPLVGTLGVYSSFVENDAGTLVAQSAAGTTRVYDKVSGTQLGREIAETAGAEFDAGGSVLMVSTREHISLWNYDVESWPALACQLAGRNLTRAEWEEVGPRTVEYRQTCPEYDIEQ